MTGERSEANPTSSPATGIAPQPTNKSAKNNTALKI